MMRILITMLLSFCCAGSALAQDAAPTGIEQRINEAIAPISGIITSVVFYSVPINGTAFPLIVLWLIAAAVFFTFYLGFINLRGVKHAIELVRGDYSDPNDAGEVSHFQALATAVSGTVGLGNIAGVAVAVSLGGPGATFWMILAGVFGMTAKFVECTFGVKYRKEKPDGTVSGGPMYYLSQGLADRGLGGLGRILAVFFAICCVGGSLGGGNMFQANQAVLQLNNLSGGRLSSFWVGVAIAVLVGVVIIGGIRSIARVTEKLVPAMAVIYLGACLIVILTNLGQVGPAFTAIFQGAFSPEGITGGFIGVLIQGFKRAAFSNEAGIGSAAIAHSAVKTKEPVTEGYVALLEPFIDTVIICTMTSLTIVITGSLATGLTGVELTSHAFTTVIPNFDFVLGVAVLMFAFSTMISWSYYGLKAWTYLFGENTFSDTVFKLIFCACVVLGASMSLGPVIDFSDSMIFAMALPNILGLYLMAPVIKAELASYRERLRKGEIKKFTH